MGSSDKYENQRDGAAELRAPSVGSYFAFKTSPLTKFSEPDTGRYAAFKVFWTDDLIIAVAVLDGIWPVIPTLLQAQQCAILEKQGFAWKGEKAAFASFREAWSCNDELLELVWIGRASLTGEEKFLAGRIARGGPGTGYAALRIASSDAEGEWRWRHDRTAVEEEVAKSDAEDAAKRKAQQERYAKRLKKLTFDQMLSETQFERWKSSPPFPPPEFAAAARQQIRTACEQLRALGPKPKKVEVRAILKRCVEWFNHTDEEFGNVIETEEREDIYCVLEEMAHAARQKSLVEEIDEWRMW